MGSSKHLWQERLRTAGPPSSQQPGAETSHHSSERSSVSGSAPVYVALQQPAAMQRASVSRHPDICLSLVVQRLLAVQLLRITGDVLILIPHLLMIWNTHLVLASGFAMPGQIVALPGNAASTCMPKLP